MFYQLFEYAYCINLVRQHQEFSDWGTAIANWKWVTLVIFTLYEAWGTLRTLPWGSLYPTLEASIAVNQCEIASFFTPAAT